MYIQTTIYEVIWSHSDHFTIAFCKNGKKAHIVAITFNKNSWNKGESYILAYKIFFIYMQHKDDLINDVVPVASL